MQRLLMISLIISLFSCSINKENNFYLVNGKYHLFKVFTPKNWVNNIKIAHENGIATFFHPENALNSKYHEVYIYANGYDSNSPSATFENFINQEKANMLLKSKNIIINEIKYDIANKKGIKQIKCISFNNIPNSYCDECVYIDTEKSVIALIFTSNSQKAYLENKNVFKNFVLNFSFISSDPGEITKIIKEDQKDRPETKYFKVPDK